MSQELYLAGLYSRLAFLSMRGGSSRGASFIIVSTTDPSRALQLPPPGSRFYELRAGESMRMPMFRPEQTSSLVAEINSALAESGSEERVEAIKASAWCRQQRKLVERAIAEAQGRTASFPTVRLRTICNP